MGLEECTSSTVETEFDGESRWELKVVCNVELKKSSSLLWRST